MGNCPWCGSQRENRCGSVHGRVYFGCNSWDAGDRRGQSVQCRLNVVERRLDLLESLVIPQSDMTSVVRTLDAIERNIVHEFDGINPQWED